MIKYLFIIVIVMNSCIRQNTIKTIYSCNGVVITRIDTKGKSYFHYGNIQGSEPDTTAPHIRAEYPLGSQTMEGYLLFKKAKKVIFVTMRTNFFQKIPEPFFTTFEFKSNVDFINWEDSLQQKFNNVVRISENTHLEDRLNKEFGSTVHIERFSPE